MFQSNYPELYAATFGEHEVVATRWNKIERARVHKVSVCRKTKTGCNTSSTEKDQHRGGLTIREAMGALSAPDKLEGGLEGLPGFRWCARPGMLQPWQQHVGGMQDPRLRFGPYSDRMSQHGPTTDHQGKHPLGLCDKSHHQPELEQKSHRLPRPSTADREPASPSEPSVSSPSTITPGSSQLVIETSKFGNRPTMDVITERIASKLKPGCVLSAEGGEGSAKGDKGPCPMKAMKANNDKRPSPMKASTGVANGRSMKAMKSKVVKHATKNKELVYDSLKFKKGFVEARQYGQATIYCSKQGLWRVKPRPGSRSLKHFNWGEKPDEMWKNVVKYVKSIDK